LKYILYILTYIHIIYISFSFKKDLFENQSKRWTGILDLDGLSFLDHAKFESLQVGMAFKLNNRSLSRSADIFSNCIIGILGFRIEYKKIYFWPFYSVNKKFQHFFSICSKTILVVVLGWKLNAVILNTVTIVHHARRNMSNKLNIIFDLITDSLNPNSIPVTKEKCFCLWMKLN